MLFCLFVLHLKSVLLAKISINSKYVQLSPKTLTLHLFRKTKPLNIKGYTKLLLQQWLKLWKFQRLGFSTKFQNQRMKECVFSMNPGKSSEFLNEMISMLLKELVTRNNEQKLP